MRKLPSVNTFNLQLPLNGEKICFFLQLFCGDPTCNGKRKYSYSIIGKIEGLNNIVAAAEIISDYGHGNRLKDRLNFECGRFIFSNVSLAAAIFNIRVRMKGNLSPGKIIIADIGIHLKYNLRQFLVNGIKTRYNLKNITEPAVMLLQ